MNVQPYTLKCNLHTLRAIIMNCKQGDYKEGRLIQHYVVHWHFREV